MFVTVFYLLCWTFIHNFEFIILYSLLKGIPSDTSKPGATPAWHAVSNNRKAAHQPRLGWRCARLGDELYGACAWGIHTPQTLTNASANESVLAGQFRLRGGGTPSRRPAGPAVGVAYVYACLLPGRRGPRCVVLTTVAGSLQTRLETRCTLRTLYLSRDRRGSVSQEYIATIGITRFVGLFLPEFLGRHSDAWRAVSPGSPTPC